MKVALVHELLTMRGGAERVLRVLAAMFPDAPIHTLLYDEKKLGAWFPKERVIPSRLQKWAGFSTNHHLYLRSFPAAVEAWDFSGYDLVISSSSAFAHGIITNGNPKHLSYVHSPARYLWDRAHDVLASAGSGPIGWARRRWLRETAHRLRVWDSEAAERADAYLAASDIVRRRIALYWRRESDTLHPPIDDAWLERPLSKEVSADAPFLVVSTLAPYKRVDLAVRACTERGLPLVVVGDGRDAGRLRALAGPTVRFVGYTEGEALGTLYASARALVFPGEEDFGLVPVEAMACGTPTVAYRAGGALESVEEGVTGAYFDEPTAESLGAALAAFDPAAFDPAACRRRASGFSRARFEEGIRRHAEAVLGHRRP